MKNLAKMVMALLFVAAAAQAEDSIIKNMNALQDGVNLIQKGFVNNSPVLIEEGIRVIMKNTKAYKNLSEKRKRLKNVAYNNLKDIEGNVKAMTLALAKKDYRSASEAYGHILVDCAACHAAVRRW